MPSYISGANITDLCGTHEDILIPSSCLNATVTGLISRTFLRADIIGKNDFHFNQNNYSINFHNNFNKLNHSNMTYFNLKQDKPHSFHHGLSHSKFYMYRLLPTQSPAFATPPLAFREQSSDIIIFTTIYIKLYKIIQNLLHLLS